MDSKQVENERLRARVAALEAALRIVSDMIQYPSGHLPAVEWTRRAGRIARVALVSP
jgi:hypothetical protein